MTNMIEKVARAICDQTACADFDNCIWCNDPKSKKSKDTCRHAAKAAIEAMQPTNEMVIAGVKVMKGTATSGGGTVIIAQPIDVWNAMIRAALEGE